MNVQGSITNKNQKVETTQRYTGSTCTMAQYTVMKKHTCYNMDEHQKREAQWKQPDTKPTCCVTPSIEMSSRGRAAPLVAALSIHQRLSKGGVPSGVHMGGSWSIFLSHTEVSLPLLLSPTLFSKNNKHLKVIKTFKNIKSPIDQQSIR